MPAVKRRLAAGLCNHCGIDETQTSLWRTGLNKERLCNACGLYVQTHGRMRPLATLGGRKKAEPKGQAASAAAAAAAVSGTAASHAGAGAGAASDEYTTARGTTGRARTSKAAGATDKARHASSSSSTSSSLVSLPSQQATTTSTAAFQSQPTGPPSDSLPNFVASGPRPSRSTSVSTSSTSLPSPSLSPGDLPSPPYEVSMDSPPPSMSASLGRLDDVRMNGGGTAADSAGPAAYARARKGQKRHSISGGSALGFPHQAINPNHIVPKGGSGASSKKKARLDQAIRPLTVAHNPSATGSLPHHLPTFPLSAVGQLTPMSPSPISIPPNHAAVHHQHHHHHHEAAAAAASRSSGLSLPCSRCADFLPFRSASVPLHEDPVCDRCLEGPARAAAAAAAQQQQRAASAAAAAAAANNTAAAISSSVPVRTSAHHLLASSAYATSSLLYPSSSSNHHYGGGVAHSYHYGAATAGGGWGYPDSDDADDDEDEYEFVGGSGRRSRLHSSSSLASSFHHPFASKPRLSGGSSGGGSNTNGGGGRGASGISYEDPWSLEEEFSFLDPSFAEDDEPPHPTKSVVNGGVGGGGGMATDDDELQQQQHGGYAAPRSTTTALPLAGWGGPFFRNMPMPPGKFAASSLQQPQSKPATTGMGLGGASPSAPPTPSSLQQSPYAPASHHLQHLQQHRAILSPSGSSASSQHGVGGVFSPTTPTHLPSPMPNGSGGPESPSVSLLGLKDLHARSMPASAGGGGGSFNHPPGSSASTTDVHAAFLAAAAAQRRPFTLSSRAPTSYQNSHHHQHQSAASVMMATGATECLVDSAPPSPLFPHAVPAGLLGLRRANGQKSTPLASSAVTADDEADGSSSNMDGQVDEEMIGDGEGGEAPGEDDVEGLVGVVEGLIERP